MTRHVPKLPRRQLSQTRAPAGVGLPRHHAPCDFTTAKHFSIDQQCPLEVVVRFSLLQHLVAGNAPLPTVATEGSRRGIDDTETHQTDHHQLWLFDVGLSVALVYEC